MFFVLFYIFVKFLFQKALSCLLTERNVCDIIFNHNKSINQTHCFHKLLLFYTDPIQKSPHFYTKKVWVL